MAKKKGKSTENRQISLNDLKNEILDAIDTRHLDDLLAPLPVQQQKYAILLLSNSQLSPVEAYQQVFQCSYESAYKNYTRVYKDPAFRAVFDEARSIHEETVPDKSTVLELLWRRSKVSLKDVAEWDRHKGFELKDSNRLDALSVSMIARLKIKSREYFDSQREIDVTETETDIQMRDTWPALKMLAEYLGITPMRRTQDPTSESARKTQLMIAIQNHIGVKEI